MYQVKEKRPKITPIFDPKITQKRIYQIYIFYILIISHHTLANLFNTMPQAIKVVFATKSRGKSPP